MKRLFLAGALLAVMLVPASSAVAAPHHPTGEFANFGDCPLSNPSATFCFYNKTTGGSFTIGSKTVPIENPVILQAGFPIFNEETGNTNFIAAEDGETLSKTPEPVPGGLTGIPAPASWPQFLKDLYNGIINNGLTGVNSTMELAGPASSVVFNPLNAVIQEGVALSMPVKIKLDNAFFGSNCYIGSNSNPVQLKLTTGTTSPPPPNEPIRGSAGIIGENAAATLLTVKGGVFVDNSFSAPGTTGCGGLFSLLVNPFVSSVVGVPSPAGHNTAILEGNTEIAQAEAVRASE